MNELQVTVNQTPGVITWNFDELKNALAAQMDEYKAVVYTDDTIAAAQADVASLRKLSKAVNARKIEIKNKCLEPYEIIEKQAKELIGLIDEPIQLISEKIDDYEKRRRAAKKEKIMQVMSDAFADLPADIRKRLECKTYDSRWENKTATEKSYRDAIRQAHDETVDALRILGNVDEDFRETVMTVYKVDLNMTAAMMKAQELQRQKEIVLERERQRREQEERMKEREKMLQEAEAKKAADPVVNEPVKEEPKEPEKPQLEVVQEETKSVDDKHVTTILFRGTDEQLKKVVGYIRYIGGECQLKR